HRVSKARLDHQRRRRLLVEGDADRACPESLRKQGGAYPLGQRAGDELQGLGIVDRWLEWLAFLDPHGRPPGSQSASVVAQGQVIDHEGFLAELAAKRGPRDRLQTADRLDPKEFEILAQVVI